MEQYYDIAFGPGARRRQEARGSDHQYAAAREQPPPDQLGSGEIDFLTRRDSFYLASVGANGWPYVQHRGGPAGFIHVIGPARLAWAERSGNRQFVTAGNLDGDDRVSIIAVDYPQRQRLKLFGHARLVSDPTGEQLAELGIEGRMEGLVIVDVVAFDWNCPKYITPRYTEDEVRAATEPLRRRIEELEAQAAAP
jgi:predicted pyridoxine 5'-phosphate oxidase superfamily flavin-nucleotide-binding protein